MTETDLPDPIQLSPPIKKKKKKKKHRCSKTDCSKKIPTISWDCKCGHRYCSKHSSPFSHNCQFNWKSDNQKNLNKILNKGKSIDTKNFVQI